MITLDGCGNAQELRFLHAPAVVQIRYGLVFRLAASGPVVELAGLMFDGMPKNELNLIVHPDQDVAVVHFYSFVALTGGLLEGGPFEDFDMASRVPD